MGHWYTIEGKPCHTVVGKNGKERDTTLADARKLKLFPSATTILSQWANPDLERASKRMLLEQAYITKIDGRDQKEWAKAITDTTFKPWNEKAELGTKVHAAIEAHLNGDTLLHEEELTTPDGVKVKSGVFVRNVMRKLEEMGFSKWNIRAIEKTVVDHIRGYAGTVDLAYQRKLEDGRTAFGVIDFKTTTTRKDEPVLTKKTHLPQIAAYWRAFFMGAENDVVNANPRDIVGEGINVYISTTEIGRVDIREYSGTDLLKGLIAFDACTDLWQIDNEYYPQSEHAAAKNETTNDNKTTTDTTAQ
jgi:hypothetical protein